MTLFSATIKPATLLLLLLSPVPALAQDSQLAQENYIQADVNNDGVLGYTEFVTFIDLNAADDLGRAKLLAHVGFMHKRLNGLTQMAMVL